MTFFGKAKIDTFKQLINFFGSYDYKYVSGELNLQLKDKIIDFYINTNKSIKTISFLKDFFRLDKVAEERMYDNVERNNFVQHTLYEVIREKFIEKFTDTAINLFGSGWVWLVKDLAGNLSIVATSNAATPITEDLKPLLTCDVWEHAYYIDTRNARPKYLENYWKLVNWNFVKENLVK